MSHAFTLTQQFPVSLDRLWRDCSRLAYVQRKYRALGAPSFRVLRFDVHPREIEVELERTVALPLPLVLRQHTVWSRAAPDRARVSIDVDIANLALRAEAKGELREASPHATEMRLEWEIHRGSRWLPAGAQRIFEREIRKSLRRDHEFTLGYLRDVPTRAYEIRTPRSPSARARG